MFLRLKGIHGLYADGGYLFQFPRSKTEANKELALLRDFRWVDRQASARTREIDEELWS
jgi:uncharacterized protein YecE (DUF72 family)